MALIVSGGGLHAHTRELRLARVEQQTLFCGTLAAFCDGLASPRLPEAFFWDEQASSGAASARWARLALAALLAASENEGAARTRLALICSHTPFARAAGQSERAG
jgi:hypothetical protein